MSVLAGALKLFGFPSPGLCVPVIDQAVDLTCLNSCVCSVSSARPFRYKHTALVVFSLGYAFTWNSLQVQQVKKTDKYTCRMCQAAQSVKKASMRALVR